ncbi:hypothetical protein BDZ97DRAFT_1111482 [Flammula alnicola]|nr:hypothetical protein BDZ97DRAFT_1111482 [Flammula alnicola]
MDEPSNPVRRGSLPTYRRLQRIAHYILPNLISHAKLLLQLQFHTTRRNDQPQHFRIQENDAFHMFMMTFDGNPGIAASLEVLDVESMDGNDFAQASELEDRFKRCPNLRELRLAVGHHYGLDANLASCIPSSVEKLDLKFSRSLPFLQSFDDWIDRAKDSSWLPHLASFHMSIDAKSKVAESQTYNPPLPDVAQTPIPQISVESFDVAFKTKRMALYDLLKSTRPKIHLTY